MIEDEREYSLMVTTPIGKHWYSLKFDCTAYLNTLDKAEAIGAFESEVENIRERLTKLYDGKDSDATASVT